MCSLNIRLEDLAASLSTKDVLKLSRMILEKAKSEKDGTTSTSSSNTMTDQPSMLPDGY
ncbi:14176_t:CDS:1, partial [Dentiscutata erythropus]